jgi:arabinogalactan endo-1,4-beta-galactosidase
MDTNEIYFTIVKWGNPYRSNDNDYAWAGGYTDRKTALRIGKRIEKRGPNAFIDWCGSSVKTHKGLTTFIKAANKVGLNPNVKVISVKDEDGNILDEIENKG